jgi:hypothetical protein
MNDAQKVKQYLQLKQLLFENRIELGTIPPVFNVVNGEDAGLIMTFETLDELELYCYRKGYKVNYGS